MATLPKTYTVAPIERVLADKTLLAIELALVADGGNKYRDLLRSTIAAAEDAYKQDSDEFRTHLGASQVGRECDREVWYGFRWAVSRSEKIEWHKELGPHNGPPCTLCRSTQARMMRLVNRGHLEEARFIALLQTIGVEVWTHDEYGRQFKVSFLGGHFGGSCDSVVRGIPDLPLEPMLAEMKTHKDSSFSKVKNQGLREAKPDHFTQMQMYMGGLHLNYGIYFAVNKDNDDIYTEIIVFDPDFFAFHQDRAKRVVFSLLPPKKISESPGWYKCTICLAKPICHKVKGLDGRVPAPQRNCRTCTSSRPGEDGAWTCTNPEVTFLAKGKLVVLTKQDQLAGCHRYLPIEGL